MSSELQSMFPQVEENDHLLEYWIFGWDNSKVYVTMKHICIYWSIAMTHAKVMAYADIKNITMEKKSIVIHLESELVTLSKFPPDIEEGVYLMMNEMWKPSLGKNEILLKANSNLYVKRRIDIPSRTAFCIQQVDGNIEKCFPLKHLVGFEYTSKPFHVKLYDKVFEIEFFIRDVTDWIPKFQTKCAPNFFVEYESKEYELWYPKIEQEVPLKQNRKQSVKYVSTRNKLDHQNLQRARRAKNHSKKKLGVSSVKQEITSWLQVDIQDQVESLFDLETLFDSKFVRCLVFRPWTWYLLLRESKVKQAIDLLNGYVYSEYPLKIQKYTGDPKPLWEKYLAQYGLALHVPVEFKEEVMTVEWIGEVDCKTWIGLDYKDGDGNGIFQGKQVFTPKTKSLFVPIENFMILPVKLGKQKKEKPQGWSLFKKKEKKVIKPILLKKSVTPTSATTSGDTQNTPEMKPEHFKTGSDFSTENRKSGYQDVQNRDETKPQVFEDLFNPKMKSTDDGPPPVVDITDNLKESNIKDLTNLSRPRRKKNVRPNIHKEVPVLDQIEEN